MQEHEIKFTEQHWRYQDLHLTVRAGEGSREKEDLLIQPSVEEYQPVWRKLSKATGATARKRAIRARRN